MKLIFRFIVRIYRKLWSIIDYTINALDILLPFKGKSEKAKTASGVAPSIFRDVNHEVADNPILTELRRRAVIELFDWLKLTHVPAQFWPLLNKHWEPGVAISFFVKSIGCDLEKLRRHDLIEIEKVQSIIDLLAFSEELFGNLSEEQRGYLREKLAAKNYKSALEVAGLLKQVNSISEKAAQVEDSSIAMAAEFLVVVKRKSNDFVNLNKREIDDLEIIIDDFLHIAGWFAKISQNFISLAKSTNTWFPPEWVDTQKHLTLQSIIKDFQSEFYSVSQDVSLSLRDVEHKTGKIRLLWEQLIRLRREADSSADATDEIILDDETKTEKAAIYFNFATPPPWPTLDEVKSRYRANMREYHGKGDPVALHETKEQYQILDKFLKDTASKKSS